MRRFCFHIRTREGGIGRLMEGMNVLVTHKFSVNTAVSFSSSSFYLSLFALLLFIFLYLLFFFFYLSFSSPFLTKKNIYIFRKGFSKFHGILNFENSNNNLGRNGPSLSLSLSLYLLFILAVVASKTLFVILFVFFSH